MWAYLQKRFLRNNLRVAVILRSVNQVHTMFALTPCISKLFLYKLLCYSELILPPQQHPHVFLSLPFPPQLRQQLTTCWLIWFCFLIAEPIGLRSRTDGEKQEKRAAHTEARLLTNSSSAGMPELSLKARPKGAGFRVPEAEPLLLPGEVASTQCRHPLLSQVNAGACVAWQDWQPSVQGEKGGVGYTWLPQGRARTVPRPCSSSGMEHHTCCYLARYF